MRNWDKLFEAEREHYRERARNLIETGIYDHFEVDDLAIMLYTKDNQ